MRPLLFSCADMCRRPGTAVLFPVAQAKNRCALPEFNVGTWTREPLARVWMGRGRDYSREGKARDWAAPNEPIDEQGCPASWYLSPFFVSLQRYTRRQDSNGNRVANPALDRCGDDLVIEAINALEGFEEHAAHEVAERARKK